MECLAIVLGYTHSTSQGRQEFGKGEHAPVPIKTSTAKTVNYMSRDKKRAGLRVDCLPHLMPPLDTVNACVVPLIYVGKEHS